MRPTLLVLALVLALPSCRCFAFTGLGGLGVRAGAGRSACSAGRRISPLVSGLGLRGEGARPFSRATEPPQAKGGGEDDDASVSTLLQLRKQMLAQIKQQPDSASAKDALQKLDDAITALRESGADTGGAADLVDDDEDEDEDDGDASVDELETIRADLKNKLRQSPKDKKIRDALDKVESAIEELKATDDDDDVSLEELIKIREDLMDQMRENPQSEDIYKAMMEVDSAIKLMQEAGLK